LPYLWGNLRHKVDVMNRMAFRLALFAAVLAFAGSAQAQPRRNYDIQPMNFDFWCQETMQWESARCARRLPADTEAFDAFRVKIEGYEIQHLEQKNRAARIEADILHGDPRDRSPTRSMQRQSQQGGAAPPLNNTIP
jgi:hypothetical protein